MSEHLSADARRILADPVLCAAIDALLDAADSVIGRIPPGEAMCFGCGHHVAFLGPSGARVPGASPCCPGRDVLVGLIPTVAEPTAASNEDAPILTAR